MELEYKLPIYRDCPTAYEQSYLKLGKFDVIERSRMNDILQEQGFQQSGCTNTECAIEAGQLIGVSKIVVGSVDKVGTIYTVDIRMVNVATGKIEKTATEDCQGCTIDNVLLTTIHNVARLLAGLEADKVVEKKPVEAQTVQQTIQPPITQPTPQPKSELQEWEKLGLKNRDEWVNFKKSGMTIDEWKNIPKKSVGGAVLLSMVIPGGGHYYNRKIGTGLFYTLLPPALIAGGVPLVEFWLDEDALNKAWNEYGNDTTGTVGIPKEDDYYKPGQRAFGVILFIFAGVDYIINIIHAGIYADRYNKGTLKRPPKDYPFKKKVSLNPSYDPINKRTRLSLSYNF